MSFDLETMRRDYKAKAPRKAALNALHNFKSESLAQKLGYYDIDYSDSQLDPDEIMEAMSKRHAALKREWKKLNKDQEMKTSWL